MELETSLSCPRCGAALNGQDLYGPCRGCREELQVKVRGEARLVDVAAYEPKSNVVPNQVATKE